MTLSFKTNKLKNALTTDKGLAKTYGTLAKKIKMRINQLKAAENLYLISCLPPLRLHPYKGTQGELWSIDVQENWRILFTVDHEPVPLKEDEGVDLRRVTAIRIESVEDPH